jgi:hypothetical protein
MRLLLYGFVGWAVCAAIMGVLLQVTSLQTALLVHACAVPVVFAVIASRYFRVAGARAPLQTALAFVTIVAALDLVVVAGMIERSLAMFRSAIGTWVPFASILVVSWAVGAFTGSAPRHTSPSA